MIQGNALRDAMISASNRLAQVKQSVDKLNVFPVPDGDTGTNMSMTLSTAARELARLHDEPISRVADVASSALLRGARGNSGVILSLLFRGLSKGLKDKTEADGVDLANALGLGVEAAYKAVMKPTEGTILTVAREAAAVGKTAAESGSDAIATFDAICKEAAASLARTPDLLPVLKKAGVVDAGGSGLCVILDEMNRVFHGGEMLEGVAVQEGKASGTSAAGLFEADITFTYCTEFIVAKAEGNTRDPLLLRAFLETIGDCVVVVDDEEIIKVHVHTNDPGKALSEGALYGQFETVKVENMRIQHKNAGWVEESGVEQTPELTPAEPEEPFGFVSVASGAGIVQMFQDLGCAHVVSGGQTMNPSTDDILQAVEATPAKTVYVLPNNKNIILAAEQAALLADRDVRVLPTRTIPQGIGAMLAFNPDADVEQNLIMMNEAAGNVSTGQITFAARDSDYEGNNIKEGQLLALDNGKLSFVETNAKRAVLKLTRNLMASRRVSGREAEFLTLMFGEDIEEDTAQAIATEIRQRFPNLEVTVVNGGQPVYYYIISIE